MDDVVQPSPDDASSAQPATEGKPSFDEAFGEPDAQKNPVVDGVLKSLLPVVGHVIRSAQAIPEGAKAFSASMSNPSNSLYTPAEQNKEASTSGVSGAAMDISAAFYDATFRPMNAMFAGATAALNKEGVPLEGALASLGKATGGLVGGPSGGSGLGDFLLNELPMSTGAMGVGQFAGVPHAHALESYAVRAPENVYMGTVRPTLEQAKVADYAARSFDPEYPKLRSQILSRLDDANTYATQNANVIGHGTDIPFATDADAMQSLATVKSRLEDTNTRLQDSNLPPDWRTKLEVYRDKLSSVQDSNAEFQRAHANNQELLQKWLNPQGPPAPPQKFTMPWDYKTAEEAGINPEEPPKPAAPAASGTTPSIASEPFQESRLMDKAGNIRLDNINTTDDLKQVLIDSAGRNDNFNAARRGVLSDGKVLDLADAMGINPAFLDKRALGEAFNAEQIKVVEKALAQSTSSVRDAMMEFNKSDKGEDAKGVLNTIMARHDMIQETYAGVTAEAGRALRALQKTDSFWESGDKALSEYLKRRQENGALEDIAKFGEKLKDPRALAKFLNDTKDVTVKDQIMFYYLNNLLSGPITHLRYSVGNLLNAVVTPTLEIPAAATSGWIRENILRQKVENRVYFGETGAQLYAMGHGFTEGARAALEAWKNNFSAPLPKERGNAKFSGDIPIPGTIGKVIGVPSRTIGSIHSFTKTLRYEQNLAGLAYRQAMKEGLEGDALDARIADLTTSPPDKMMESATKDALKETYMEPTDYHSFMGKVQRVTNDNMLAKMMIPFAKVGGQITKNAFLERTPIGYLNEEIRNNLMGKNGEVARDMQVAKISVGTFAIGTGVMMALHGKLTGDGPEDPELRDTWLRTHTPNSMQIGNITVPYRGLGPYGLLLGFAANMTETAQGWNGEDGHKLMVSALEGMTKSVLDQNFMLGVKNALDAVYHPDEYADRYLRDFATNWLPFSVGMGQVAREIDPYQREVKDIFSAARAKIPFASESLMPRYDSFGNPIKQGYSTYEQYKTDPVQQRLEALHTGIGRLEDKINDVKLTDEQYAEYSRMAGRTTYMMLSAKVRAGLQFLPPGEQVMQIKRTVEQAREVARGIIKYNPSNYNIIHQATEKKRAIFAPAAVNE